MLGFGKYYLYSFLRFALFRERRHTGEEKASKLLLKEQKERRKLK
jgi:hypothetical protein